MNIVIIIQARMGSTRFPGKILKPLGNKTVLEHVVDNCKKSKRVKKIIVATSTLEKDNKVEEFLKEKNISCFRGSEADVLSRYYHCAKDVGADMVVRVTADCPFLDSEVVDMVIDKAVENEYDYTATMSNSSPRTFPHGIDCEVIKFSALERGYNEATTAFDKEHVCPYIHTTKKDEFSLGRVDAPVSKKDPNIRITLDTPEDYELCLELIKFLPRDYTTEDIIKIYKEKPYLYEINQNK